jgi:serine/threonine-protein kinase
VADLDRLGLIGQTVDGRYTILEQIGEGGMGTVYRAEHQRLGRQVAIKVLHQAYAKDHTALDRFFNEARAAATLGHPNIAESFDVGELSDGSPFIVLELLHGRSIDEEVGRAGRLSIRRALRIARQIAQGLDAAHQRGIIHRDLKSENVLLTERADTPDHVKILDFGVARIVENSASITQPGHMVGTPEVMPPEQILSPHTIDARVDIYAAGVILYQTLSGHKPFESVPMPALFHRILEESPPALTFLPDDVRALVEDAMARDRNHRIQTAIELRDRIDACLADLTGPAPADLTGPAPADLTGPAPADLTGPAPADLTGPVPADLSSPSLLAAPAPTLVERRSGDGRYRSLKIRAAGAAGTFALAGVVFAIVHAMGHSPGQTPPRPPAPVEVAMSAVDVPAAAPRAELAPAAPAPVAPAPDPTPPATTGSEPGTGSANEPVIEPVIEIEPQGIAGAQRPAPARPRAKTRPHTAPHGAAHTAAPREELAGVVAAPGPSDEAGDAAPAHVADEARPAATAPEAHAPAVAVPTPPPAPPPAPPSEDAPAPPVASAPDAPAVKHDEIDVAATRAAVLGHVAAIQQCYERAKMDDMTLAGAITVRITIGPDGAVTGAEVARSTIRSAAVEHCVTGEIARWHLPRPRGGHAASFLYPFVFE